MIYLIPLLNSLTDSEILSLSAVTVSWTEPSLLSVV